MINGADIRLDLLSEMPSWFFRLFKYWLSGFVGINSDYKNSSLVLFISEIYFNLQVETDDSCRSEEQQNQRCVTNQSYQWSLTSEGVAVVINQNVCVCSINHGGKRWIWILIWISQLIGLKSPSSSDTFPVSVVKMVFVKFWDENLQFLILFYPFFLYINDVILFVK